VEALDANWHYIGDANFTRLKAALDLSIRPFQRRFHTYIRPSCQGPVVRRCFLEDRRVWRLRKRIRTVDSDANSTGLKAPSDLSIQRFLRSFNTYRRPFWQVPVVRRCFVENRMVWRLWQFGSRCEVHLIESPFGAINTELSEKL
jgi:hypothetical protein